MPPTLPRLTQAQAPLTREIWATDEHGREQTLSIPCERALTIYVDKQEVVTLMTLGAHPEWLVLGYLRNQRLIDGVGDVEAITVDWDAGEAGAGVAAVKTRNGVTDLAQRTAKRVVTTGCGQGSMFGDLMTDTQGWQLPATTLLQAQLINIVQTIRSHDSIYKKAGSVHACALFRADQLQLFVEDVGRHNAIDTIAGWMWLQDTHALNTVFYTTGRLTSEMVLKSAQMQVAIIISRSGTTEMGHQIATQLGLCTVGRASGQHFMCYSAKERLVW